MLDICACFCKGHFAFRNISVSRDPESPSVSWALNPIRHETTDLPLLGRHYRLFKRGSTNGRKRGRQFQTSCKGCTQPWTESHQGHKRFPDSFWFFNAGKSHTLHRLITGDIHHVAIIGKPTFFFLSMLWETFVKMEAVQSISPILPNTAKTQYICTHSSNLIPLTRPRKHKGMTVVCWGWKQPGRKYRPHTERAHAADWSLSGRIHRIDRCGEHTVTR